MMSQSAASADGCGYRVAALLVLASLTSSGHVYAQATDPLQLSWQAPASCPHADAVRARVRALAGSASAAGVQLKAAGTVARRSDGQYALTLTIQMDQLVGERKLEARTCEALAGATAVSLALLLKDPSPLGSSEATKPQPSAADAQTALPETAPAAAQLAPAPPSPDTPAQEPNESDLHAILQLPRLALGLGPLRAPSIGLSVGAGAAHSAWTLVASATWWLPHTQASDRLEAHVHLQRIAASMHVCRAFPFGRLEVAPCATLTLEHLRARGVGAYVRTATASANWLAAGAGLQARFQLTPWLHALGRVELKLQAARPRISIHGIGQVAQLGPVAAELFFGAEWIL